MSAAATSNLFPFTDCVRALSKAPSFAAFIEPLKSKPGVTDSYIETLCQCFLSSRKGDVESAAQRFVAFTHVVTEHNLSFALDPDIVAGLSLNFLLLLAPSGNVNMDPNGRPAIHMLPRNIDYSKASVHQMKKTWFFVMMQVAFSCPAARELGVVVVNNMKGASRSAFNMEFQGCCLRADAFIFLPPIDCLIHSSKDSSPKPYPVPCLSKSPLPSSFTSRACSASFGPSCHLFCHLKSGAE